MATVQNLVDSAFRLLGVIDAGGSPSASESTDAFNALNQLLANWSAADVPVHSTVRDAFTLTGAASYTIGSGATINVARPLKIKAATVVVSNAVSPLKPIGPAEWAAITDRTRAGKFAERFYYDGGYPTGTIYLHPTPASGGTLELFSLKPLTAFSALSDTINMAPGYEHAMRFALAEALAPEYGVAITEAVAKGAAEAKGAIAKLNAEVLGIELPAESPAQ